MRMRDMTPEARAEICTQLYFNFTAVLLCETDKRTQEIFLARMRESLPKAENAEYELYHDFCVRLLDDLEELWKNLEVLKA